MERARGRGAREGKGTRAGCEIGTGIIFAASRKWWKELARRKLLGRTDGPHAGGGVTPGVVIWYAEGRFVPAGWAFGTPGKNIFRS